MTDLTVRGQEEEVCQTVKSICVDERGSLVNVKIKSKVDHCDVAKVAIQGVLIVWDIGWLNLTPTVRKGLLALEIVNLLAGQRFPHGKKWKNVGRQPWTAQDCAEVLRICKGWSHDGSYGESLIGMAAETPDWKHDPIPGLKRRIFRLHCGG